MVSGVCGGGNTFSSGKSRNVPQLGHDKDAPSRHIMSPFLVPCADSKTLFVIAARPEGLLANDA